MRGLAEVEVELDTLLDFRLQRRRPPHSSSARSIHPVVRRMAHRLGRGSHRTRIPVHCLRQLDRHLVADSDGILVCLGIIGQSAAVEEPAGASDLDKEELAAGDTGSIVGSAGHPAVAV